MSSGPSLGFSILRFAFAVGISTGTSFALGQLDPQVAETIADLLPEALDAEATELLADAIVRFLPSALVTYAFLWLTTRRPEVT